MTEEIREKLYKSFAKLASDVCFKIFQHCYEVGQYFETSNDRKKFVYNWNKQLKKLGCKKRKINKIDYDLPCAITKTESKEGFNTIIDPNGYDMLIDIPFDLAQKILVLGEIPFSE